MNCNQLTETPTRTEYVIPPLGKTAAQRIPLDLDDGVKVNYRKFGDLLAEVKAVIGGKAEG